LDQKKFSAFKIKSVRTRMSDHHFYLKNKWRFSVEEDSFGRRDLEEEIELN